MLSALVDSVEVVECQGVSAERQQGNKERPFSQNGWLRTW